MPLIKKRPRFDEEFCKKDDDYWRAREPSTFPKLLAWRGPRRRRALLIIVSLYLVYRLISMVPLNFMSSDTPCDSTSEKTQQEEDQLEEHISSSSSASDMELNDFDGPIRLARLSKSLHNIEKKLGNREDNNNVLFAAASLTGISELIPLACDMAREKTNIVHFAIMGRHDLPMRTLLKVNGVGATECPVHWHDARPDNGKASSEHRMEKSVRRGLGHMNQFIKLQVVITNNVERDELFLWNGITQNSQLLGLAHIGLPHATSDLGWISRLDTESLKAWNKFRIEILIQAPTQSSGSMLRLLKSLGAADYLGTTIGLTIELPQNVDPILLQHLENWEGHPNPQGSKITLRRHIRHSLTPEEAAGQAIEAFYPHNPAWSHVLLLSPQTELSPSYFHYLRYTVLKYKYSGEARSHSENLLGISLDLPPSGPSENDDFTPFFKGLGEDGLDEVTPLALWQAPNSNAILYFGDKWAELHNFMSNRLTAPRKDPSQTSTIVSKKYPAFMEYLLELTRARGYYILYPFFYAKTGVSLATVHNELYQPPEEFEDQVGESGRDTSEPSRANQGLGSIEQVLYSSWSLSDLLRDFSLRFPDLSSMPILAYTGERERDIVGASKYYATEFSKQFGDCSSSILQGDKTPLKTDDLFCLNGDD